MGFDLESQIKDFQMQREDEKRQLMIKKRLIEMKSSSNPKSNLIKKNTIMNGSLIASGDDISKFRSAYPKPRVRVTFNLENDSESQQSK